MVVPTGVIILLFTTIAIYSIIAIGLNMQWGETGMINFGFVAFFGIGAYASALLTTPAPDLDIFSRTVGFSFPIVVGLLGAFIAAAVIGGLLGALTRNVGGSFYALMTLAFQEVALAISRGEGWLTNGAQGFTVEPLFPSLSGTTADLVYLGVSVLCLLIIYLLSSYLTDSGFGRIINAIREDELVPQSLGKNTTLAKIKVAGLSSGLAGFGGALWVHYTGFVGPTVFPLTLTFLIWIGVIIGGPGKYSGAVAGTAMIMLFHQSVRYIPSDIPMAENLPYIRVIVIGFLMILVLYYRPYGLLGDKERYYAGEGSEGV